VVIDKAIGTNLDVQVTLAGGKVVVTVSYAGIDAELDVIKAKLPVWLQPLVDLVKIEVDKVA
jgi:hypothetical protein